MSISAWREGMLVVVAVAAVLGLSWLGRVPQDPAYHLFADTRALAGIGNFWNVVSNLAFVAVGLYGLWRVPRLAQRESRPACLVLCTAVIGVGFGSAWYHAAPSNASLLWDRLPMTVAFMALFTLLLEERVLKRRHAGLLLLLVALGVGSALSWALTEKLGVGDLRPYLLVQFLPILLLPLILLLFPRRFLGDAWLWSALALYAIAKGLESFDAGIMQASNGLMAGHALKHVAAAAAVLCLIEAVPLDSRHRNRGG